MSLGRGTLKRKIENEMKEMFGSALADTTFSNDVLSKFADAIAKAVVEEITNNLETTALMATDLTVVIGAPGSTVPVVGTIPKGRFL